MYTHALVRGNVRRAITPTRQPGASRTDDIIDTGSTVRVACANTLIRRAIAEKLQVITTYDGHRRGRYPHLLGTTNGRRQALRYQLGGSSRSVDVVEPGLVGNWSCIPLARLAEVSLGVEAWHIADNFAATQTCVAIIDVAVADAEADAGL